MKPTLLLLLLFLQLFSPGTVGAQITNEECLRCHITKTPGLADDPSALAVFTAQEQVSDEMMCYSCHDGSVLDDRATAWNGQSHKVGSKITLKSVKVPSNFPLRNSGLYCGTCHSPHILSDNSWLRADNTNSNYCINCHNSKSGNSDNGNHPKNVPITKIPAAIIENGGKFGLDEYEQNVVICQSCHVVHGAPPGAQLLIKHTSGEAVDRSELCETCHSANPSKDDYRAGIGTHSVNIKPDKYQIPPLTLTGEPFARGKEGRIICRTCHKPHNATKSNKLLVEENKNGRFCMRCHGGRQNREHRIKSAGGHPIGVKLRPDMILVDEYLELEDSTITCNTCHGAHNTYLEPLSAEEEQSPLKKQDKNSLLQASNRNSRLCEECHNAYRTSDVDEAEQKGTHPVNIISNKIKIPQIVLDSGGTIGDNGKLICNTCHPMHKGKPTTSNLIDTNLNSRMCGYCHLDYNVDTIEEAAIVSTHPVNIKTDKITISDEIFKAGGRLGLNKEIICNTCHKAHNAEPDTMNLVLPSRRSALCVICHKQQQTVTNTEHNLEIIAPMDTNLKRQRPRESGACGVCHLAHNGNGPKVWARRFGEEQKGQDVLTKLCLSCHRQDENAEKKQIGEHTHPSFTLMRYATGKTDLPLFMPEGVMIPNLEKEQRNRGVVTCGTCHNVHQWDPNDAKQGTKINTEGNYKNSFLRKTNFKNEMCFDCHPDTKRVIGTEHDLTITARNEKNIAGRTAQETGPCGACHMVHNGTNSQIWAKKILDPDTGAPIAQNCNSCHSKEGCASASLVGDYTHKTNADMEKVKHIKAATSMPLFTKDGHREHRNLREAEYDNDKLVNSYGYVTCGTCHNVHQWDPYDKDNRPGKNLQGDAFNSFLRKPNDIKSTLCKECHPDKKIEGTEHDMRVVAPKETNIAGQTVNESGICSSCHFVHSGKYNRMWSRKVASKGGVITQLCNGCHQEGENAQKKLVGDHSHPIDTPITDYRIEVKLPRHTNGFRDDDGNVTCATCHDVHNWNPDDHMDQPGRNTEGTAANSFLRVSNLKQSRLCGECHYENVLMENTEHDMRITAPNSTNIMGRTVAQTGPCGTCHMVHNGLDIKLWARVPAAVDPSVLETGERDILSALCISCHSKDNPAAKKVLTGGISHPINIDQIQSGIPTSLPLFNEAGDRVIDGRISCATCHNPHQWDPSKNIGGPGKNTEGTGSNSFLRLENKRTAALCVDCHQRTGLVIKTDHDMFITVPDEKNSIGEIVGQSGACSACHLMHNAKDKRRWAKKLGPEENELTGKKNDYITRMCESCHIKGGCAESKVGEHTHSVNTKLSPKMTTTLPLYTFSGKKTTAQKTGLVTCLTCHYVHQWSPTQYSASELKQGVFSNVGLKNATIGSVAYLAFPYIYIDTKSAYKVVVDEEFMIFSNGEISGRVRVDKINPMSQTMEVFAEVIESVDSIPINVGDIVVPKKLLAKGVEGDGTNSFLRKPNDRTTSLCFDCHLDMETMKHTDHDLSLTAPREKNVDGHTVDNSGLCSACHLAHNGRALYVAAKEINPIPGQKLVTATICLSCHAGNGCAQKKEMGIHHKIINFPTDEQLDLVKERIGKIPSEMMLNIPDKKLRLPLYDSTGAVLDEIDFLTYVTCSTCHNVHQWDPQNADIRHPFDTSTGKYVVEHEGDMTNSYLRMSNKGYNLCNACHAKVVHLRQEEMRQELGINAELTTEFVAMMEAESEQRMRQAMLQKKQERKIINVLDFTRDPDKADLYYLEIKVNDYYLLKSHKATDFKFSDKPDLTAATWHNFVRELKLKLPNGLKSERIYLQLRDLQGEESKILSIDVPLYVNIAEIIEEETVLPTVKLLFDVPGATEVKLALDKYSLLETPWQPYRARITYQIPDEEIDLDEVLAVFKSSSGKNTPPYSIRIPPDLILPRIVNYEWPSPVRIGDNFWVRLTFSETLKTQSPPRIKLINVDGGSEPSIDIYNVDWEEVHGENDTIIYRNIVMEERMGGNFIISVKGATGVVDNEMAPVTTKTMFFDTRPDTLEFYNKSDFQIKEGETVYKPKINLELTSTPGALYRAGEDESFPGVRWEKIEPEIEYLLSPMAGEKTVYVQYRSATNLLSAVIAKKVNYAKSIKSDILIGKIDGIKSLEKINSPYTVYGRLVISRNAKLIIEPGVTLLFGTNKRGIVSEKGAIEVRGTLVAKGTPGDPITFTDMQRRDPTPGAWDGIYLYRTWENTSMDFANVVVEYSENGINFLAAVGSITNSVFQKNSKNGVVLHRDSIVDISKTSFSNNKGNGITIIENKSNVKNCIFENNKIAILLKGAANPRLISNLIKLNDTGIQAEEMSVPVIRYNIIEDNEYGVRLMSAAYPTISNCSFADNSRAAIHIDNAAPMIYRCNFDGNNIAIYATKYLRDIVVKQNNFIDTVEINIKLFDFYGGNIIAPFNWWGYPDKLDVDETIYDREEYEAELASQSSAEEEEEEFSFDFMNEEKVSQQKKAEKEAMQKKYIAKKTVVIKHGKVHYMPFELFEIEGIGIE